MVDFRHASEKGKYDTQDLTRISTTGDPAQGLWALLIFDRIKSWSVTKEFPTRMKFLHRVATKPENLESSGNLKTCQKLREDLGKFEFL